LQNIRGSRIDIHGAIPLASIVTVKIPGDIHREESNGKGTKGEIIISATFISDITCCHRKTVYHRGIIIIGEGKTER